MHDRRANKTCTTRKRLQNHTPRNPSLKLFVCVLVLVAAPFAWWTMMAELCFSVDDLILEFFSKTAADTASEYESYGHRRCWTAATVPVAVVFACGVCCCTAEEIQNKTIDRKTELRHHRLPSKGHSNEYENNTRKSFKDGFLGVWFWRPFESCTLYLHDGRANRGCHCCSSFGRTLTI